MKDEMVKALRESDKGELRQIVKDAGLSEFCIMVSEIILETCNPCDHINCENCDK